MIYIFNVLSRVINIMAKNKSNRFKNVKEEEDMSKTKVKFVYTDGCPVTRSGKEQFINLKSPFGIVMKPNTKMQLNIGASCSHKLFVHQFRDNICVENTVYNAGKQLVVLLSNNTKDEVMIERGDTVANASILDNSNVVVE